MSVVYSAAKGSSLSVLFTHPHVQWLGWLHIPCAPACSIPRTAKMSYGPAHVLITCISHFARDSTFLFYQFCIKVFKIRLLMQDLVKESSNGLTGRTEEGWNSWQRREDLIPEEITNYTLLFIEAKKVG